MSQWLKAIVGGKPGQRRKKIVGMKILNKNLQDATGETIEFPDLLDNEAVTVGAKAEIDKKPFSGEFVMPDGSVFVFSSGILKEIIPPDDEHKAFMHDARKRNISASSLSIGNYIFAAYRRKTTVNKIAYKKPQNVQISVKKELEEIRKMLDNIEPDRASGLREYLAKKRNKVNPTATPGNRFAGISDRVKNLKSKKRK